MEHHKKHIILAFFLGLFRPIPCAGNFQVHHTTLSKTNNATLFWNVDYESSNIEFEVHVKIKKNGWFGIGFSNYGEFTQADLCIYWTDWRKRVHFEDTWINSKGFIEVDAIQDCKRFKHNKNQNQLKFKFERTFDTCDSQDYLIEDGTTHIIWVIGEGPLYQIKGLNLPQTIKDMGFQRVRLLQNQDPSPGQPQDTFVHDVLASSVRVPNVETTYWCHIHKLPIELNKKHHIIQYEPVIEEKSQGIVHHMEVFHCEAPSKAIMPNYAGPCEGPDRPNVTSVCKRVLAAWAMGALSFSYPQEAGLAIGGTDFNPFIMLEVHYHNPELVQGLIDNSGIRLYITKSLRKYDGGVMELGLEYTDKMAIPPGQPKFSLSGFCIKECTAVSLPEGGIVVFASQLHTHLTGKRVYTKHIRNGFELTELNRDNHYSQHFQEIRKLKRPIRILPGDALITTCEYDTTLRENITLGGFSITDEMCVNYIHYYPKTNLEVCKSAISEKDLHDYFHFMALWENQNTLSTKAISEKYKNIEWTPLRVEGLKNVYEHSQISMQCNMSSGMRFPGIWEGAKPTNIQIALPASVRPCMQYN